MAYGWEWRPYVPVAMRRAQAMVRMEKLRKKGENIQPVRIEGRKIARTFWGESWCEHLEKFSDYSNRLPRGRTYVRNGSVCHLDIAAGRISAMVSGSDIYKVEVTIRSLAKDKWQRVKAACSGRIGSLIELLQGKLSDQVMAVVTDRGEGLFPQPEEISLKCSCPDWANMCKHVAAVLYGIGARLDERPELLFLLRGVDHAELVTVDAAKAAVGRSRKTDDRTLQESDLSEVFGIDVAPVADLATARKTALKTAAKAKPETRSQSKATAVAKAKLQAKIKEIAKTVATKANAKAKTATKAKTKTKTATKAAPGAEAPTKVAASEAESAGSVGSRSARSSKKAPKQAVATAPIEPNKTTKRILKKPRGS